MFFTKYIRSFYERFEHRISSLFLFLGFIFDVFTLKRVDAIFENAIIVIYLLLIGIFITLIHTTEKKVEGEKNFFSPHFWYVSILQFLFGGVFSAYLILYFLAIYSFIIFFIPVALHKIGKEIFLFSGLVSLILIFLFIKALFYFIKDKLSKTKKLLQVLIAIIFILVNFLYFTNLIPPIPLSLKDAGVFHSIQKNKQGNYDVTYENLGWKEYLTFYPNFHEVPGSSIHAFSAVFSPKNLNITIFHEWQRYDETKKGWTTERVMHLPVVGGRDGGFRTYSSRSDLAQGKWQVNIKTEQGQIIGRLRFNVILVNEKPELTAAVK